MTFFQFGYMMSSANLALIIIGILIPIGTGIFWSVITRIPNKLDNKSSVTAELIRWTCSHRAKFNVIIGIIVTVIEFFALIPF